MSEECSQLEGGREEREDGVGGGGCEKRREREGSEGGAEL